MNISLIGAGKMAKGISANLISNGHSITIFNKTIEKAEELANSLGEKAAAQNITDQIDDEIVILALPYKATLEVVNTYKDKLSSKILVDISNPIDFTTFDVIAPVGSSAAEEISSIVPGARVIKAFNTVFAGVLLKDNSDGEKTDVFLAGDDMDAKNILKEAINSDKLRVLDAGPLKKAHALESFQAMHMAMQGELGNTWMSSIKILP